ncbi:hypothetical protein M0R45_002118 [Rubus argutus]|uniref:Uncharacterized protein n=1 Tax=Rubus argutus TaxID=59490 RepID=A0AAW1VK69_RUBAR
MGLMCWKTRQLDKAAVGGSCGVVAQGRSYDGDAVRRGCCAAAEAAWLDGDVAVVLCRYRSREESVKILV